MKKGAGLFKAEEAAEIIEDWYVETHPLAPGVPRKLGLGVRRDDEEVAAAYARYGVVLRDWMRIKVSGDDPILMANREEHKRIAGINFLLGQGFTITKDSAR